jgi:hypothetical protein
LQIYKRWIMAFVHPYGIIGFASHIEFTGSLIFCQDVDLDVLDFQLFGVEYIVVFYKTVLISQRHYSIMHFKSL